MAIRHIDSGTDDSAGGEAVTVHRVEAMVPASPTLAEAITMPDGCIVVAVCLPPIAEGVPTDTDSVDGSATMRALRAAVAAHRGE